MTVERHAFGGRIAEVAVSELFRSIVDGVQTGEARFETNLGTATVWFREGTIIDADMGRFHMGDAIRRLMQADTGSFSVELRPVSRRQLIRETTADLLGDAPPRSSALEHSAPASNDELASRRARGRKSVAGWHPTGGGAGQARDVPGKGKMRGARDAAANDASSAGAASADMLRRLDALRRAAYDGQQQTADVLDRTAPLGATGTPSSKANTAVTAMKTVAPVRRDAGPPSVDDEQTLALPRHSPRPAAPPDPDLETERFKDNKGSAPRRTSLGMATPPPTEAVALSVGPKPRGTPLRLTDAKAVQAAPGHARPDSQPSKTQGTVGGTATATAAPVDAETVLRFAPPPKPQPEPAAQPKPTAEAEDRDGPTRATFIGVPSDLDVTEPSDPIPVGTTWEARAPTTSPAVTSPADDRPRSAGGEIRAGGRTKSGTAIPEYPPASAQQHPAAPVPARHPPTGTVRPVDPRAEPGPSPLVATPGASPLVATPGASPLVATPGASPLVATPGPASRGGTAVSRARASGIAEAIGMPTPPVPPPIQSPTSQVGNGAGHAAPAVVGRYEVLLRIARGGMGTVYLCRVTGAGGFRRLFALKVIRDHLSRNEEYVRMLLQEARIASRLHHPNVVGIVDIGSLASQHYLVMDYVEGCTVSELLKVHRKSRPPQLIIPLVLDALTGLHAAHTLTEDDGTPLTLVHCDFSPQNMLVGTNGICRITDFGISKASNMLPERSSITRGKPAYLSPEQVSGRVFDARADVFAAGVVLWNALTGEQLFSADTPEEILDRVLNMPIPAPSSVGLRPPRSLDRVVLRALERDPNMRFQSAEEMLIDLRRVAITEDLLAPSSEVARWVADTFGAQLELRRQAAGITVRGPAPPGASGQAPMLALTAGTGNASGQHPSQADPEPDESASQTIMLHTATAASAQTAGLAAKQRTIVFGLAAVLAGAVLAVAFMRPEWIQGGWLDEDGAYYEPAVAVEPPEGNKPPTPPSAPDGKGDAPTPPSTPDGKGDGTKTPLVPGTKPDAKAPPPGEAGSASAGAKPPPAADADPPLPAASAAGTPPAEAPGVHPMPAPAAAPARPTPTAKRRPPRKPKPRRKPKDDAEPETPTTKPSPPPKPPPAPEPELPPPPNLEDLGLLDPTPDRE